LPSQIRALSTLGMGLILALGAARASAQEKGALGLDALAGNSTATIGARWHITKKFALRPTVAFSRVTSEQDTTVIADGTQAVGKQQTLDWTLGAGLAGLYYISQGEALSTYVGASYSHNHQSESVNPLIFPPIDTLQTPNLAHLESIASVFQPNRTGANANVVGALFGIQHALSKKVTLFGELGIDYSFQSLNQKAILSPSETQAILSGSGSSQSELFSYTGGIGIVFYLK
jgi:hypothetical protein